MNYKHIVQAEFVDRPNRFIAHVKIQGQEETVHVKNTGRCKELLLPGATVYLDKSENPSRTTAYDLIAVEKGERLINMDSQAPNKVVEEWLNTKTLFPDLCLLRPETTYGNSRFDFYVETENEKIFIEVKGVTREQDGIVCFPDAPSERAIKHVQELAEAAKAGYSVYVIFVVQMEKVLYFTPDTERHPEFATALKEASEKGVKILAYDCLVEPNEMKINHSVPVVLDNLKDSLASYSLETIKKPLLKWYDINRRVLPWREDPTPYHVWVSEIMLQQTRVEAVKPYYARFMEALPTIESLAEAQEETLLKLWEGLGYYNRVRNLQLAAKQIMEEHNGRMPASYEAIMELKGIGSYTAGAVASIAFGLAEPAVDGNVLRVLSRLRMDPRVISDSKVKNIIEDEVREAMSKKHPGDYNQAMMELGACVCVPNGAPHCEVCPLQSMCFACRYQVQERFPVKAKKANRKIEEKTVLLIRDENKVALHKREAGGLLAGMYEFPMLEGKFVADKVTEYLTTRGLKVIRIQKLRETKHIFSHKEWHMVGYMIRVDELEKNEAFTEDSGWIYVEPAETEKNYPIPSAFESYTDYLQMKIGNRALKEE